MGIFTAERFFIHNGLFAMAGPAGSELIRTCPESGQIRSIKVNELLTSKSSKICVDF